MSTTPARPRPRSAATVPDAPALLAAWLSVVRDWPGASQRILLRVGTRPWPLVALSLPGGRRRALLIAGIHGDEPAGPRALLQLFRAPEAAMLRDRWTFDVLPLVNPAGYEAGTRGRAGCPDLNRAFGRPPACPETAAITRYIRAIVEQRRSGADARPVWELVLSLHEDPDQQCLYLYDTGYRERHALAAAMAQSAALLDQVEQHGVPVCRQPFLEGDLNRDGVLIGGQTAFPALEPTLFRSGLARRVVIVETPGRERLTVRERAHRTALWHFLATEAPARLCSVASGEVSRATVGDAGPARAGTTKHLGGKHDRR